MALALSSAVMVDTGKNALMPPMACTPRLCETCTMRCMYCVKNGLSIVNDDRSGNTIFGFCPCVFNTEKM